MMVPNDGDLRLCMHNQILVTFIFAAIRVIKNISSYYIIQMNLYLKTSHM